MSDFAKLTLPSGKEINLPIKKAQIGQDVIELQQKLTDKGFSPGAIDGDFGENTKQAVIAFQRSVGLTADGIVGPRTRKALGL